MSTVEADGKRLPQRVTRVLLIGALFIVVVALGLLAFQKCYEEPRAFNALLENGETYFVIGVHEKDNGYGFMISSGLVDFDSMQNEIDNRAGSFSVSSDVKVVNPGGETLGVDLATIQGERIKFNYDVILESYPPQYSGTTIIILMDY